MTKALPVSTFLPAECIAHKLGDGMVVDHVGGVACVVHDKVRVSPADSDLLYGSCRWRRSSCVTRPSPERQRTPSPVKHVGAIAAAYGRWLR